MAVKTVRERQKYLNSIIILSPLVKLISIKGLRESRPSAQGIISYLVAVDAPEAEMDANDLDRVLDCVD